MKVIYKYQLVLDGIGGLCRARMPNSANVLTAGYQGSNIFVWAEVDTETPEVVTNVFEVFGTGHPIHEDMGVERKFINTVFMVESGLVFHVYQVIS